MNKRLNPSSFIPFFSKAQDHLAEPLGLREGNVPSHWKQHCCAMQAGWEGSRSLMWWKNNASLPRRLVLLQLSLLLFQEGFSNSWVLLKQIVWFLAVYSEHLICFVAQKHLWTMMFLCQHVLEEVIFPPEAVGVRIQIRALSTSLFSVKDYLNKTCWYVFSR